MSTPNSSASARNHGRSESYTYQLPQRNRELETPTSVQQRNIRIAVSPRKPSRNVPDPDHSPRIPRTPETFNNSRALAANKSPSLNQSLGHKTPTHDTSLGDASLDGGDRAAVDEHRLEAAARLTHVLSSTFFENAKSLNEQINQLAALWTSVYLDNVYITTLPGSVAAKETPAQIEKTRRKSESAAVLQSLDEEQKSNSNGKSIINGDDSALITPNSRSLKRKGSNLTPSYNARVPKPPNLETVTKELYRFSLGEPPIFNLDISPEQLPTSPTELRRIRPCVRRITSENDLQPAKIVGPNATGGTNDLSITSDDPRVSAVRLQDPPSYIQSHKHDKNDDPYGPFTRSDHDVMILTKDALLPVGDSYAKLSHPGSRAEETSAQDSKGSIDRPIGRKLAPYTKRPPKSLAPEMIICQAIVKTLTKPEMGIAWMKTSSGTWIQQTSHTGWIYIYQLPNELNTVKIGITQVSIEGRLDAWTEQCGHITQIAYPTTESERESVPNIYRLEALVQAELAACRLEEVGCSCGTRHIEWFDEALAHARKVVVKWSEWMRTNPYKEVQPQHWHLSPHYIPDLAELSRPSPRNLAEGSAINPIRI